MRPAFMSILILLKYIIIMISFKMPFRSLDCKMYLDPFLVCKTFKEDNSIINSFSEVLI